MRDSVEEKDIIAVPELLPKHFQKKPVLVLGSIVAKKTNTLKARYEKENEDNYHPKSEENFDDQKAVLFLSTTNE